MNGSWGISYEIALRWMPQDLTDDKSTLVQVMAWCRQATSHYLSQCWSMSPNGVTRPQWVKYPVNWKLFLFRFQCVKYWREHEILRKKKEKNIRVQLHNDKHTDKFYTYLLQKYLAIHYTVPMDIHIVYYYTSSYIIPDATFLHWLRISRLLKLLS